MVGEDCRGHLLTILSFNIITKETPPVLSTSVISHNSIIWMEEAQIVALVPTLAYMTILALETIGSLMSLIRQTTDSIHCLVETLKAVDRQDRHRQLSDKFQFSVKTNRFHCLLHLHNPQEECSRLNRRLVESKLGMNSILSSINNRNLHQLTL